jgi:magnesium transporter
MQFEITQEYLNQLTEAVEKGNDGFIISCLSELHPADIAEVLELLPEDEARYIFKLVENEKAGDTLLELDEEAREQLLESLTTKEIAAHIEDMDSDDAADVVAELPEDKQREVISQIEDKEQVSDIEHLLEYDENTAGALMARELIRANINWPVDQCIVEMRKQAENVETVYTIYVVDNDGILVGLLSLKSLLFGNQKTLISDLYQKDIKSVEAHTSREDVANTMEKYDLVVLPVVDQNGKLVGRITIDDVVDVIKEEADKDYQMMSGISQNIESTDRWTVISRARLPWLIVGMFGGIAASILIGVYEPDIMLHPEMAFFIPLIAAMGGNVGVQSSALVVQGLANNSMAKDGIVPKLLKEFGIGILNGIICAVLIFLYNYFVSDSYALSFTVSIALFAVICFAAVFGTFVPLILDKYKVDPALATGPFITTMNDIVGLVIYFLIGKLFYFYF